MTDLDTADGTTATGAAEPIGTDLDDLRRGVMAAAVDFGRTDLAGELSEAEPAGNRLDAGSEVHVLVVGEKKRGKSSLINALVGEDGLLPVDIDIATSCYIAVRAGAERGAVVLTDDAPEGIPIPVGAIAEWASVEGNRDPDDPDRVLHDGVRGVEVTLATTGLGDDIVLVDTPGVGGLEAGHTELTLAALDRADALVFVLDPASPLTAPELSFVERAARRVSTVLFVLTKTDVYPGWRELLDDDRALIARHAPRFADAPWFAVSAALAADAADARAGGDAATCRRAGGASRDRGPGRPPPRRPRRQCRTGPGRQPPAGDRFGRHGARDLGAAAPPRRRG